MGIIRQSFKRQLFAIFLTVTLILVIIGGVFTIQGFQARLKYDYEKKDIEQNTAINSLLQRDIELSEETLDLISKSDIIKNALTQSKNSSLTIYSELYNVSRRIRDFATVDIYQGDRCVFSTSARSLSNKLPLYYSVLEEAKNSKGEVIYALDPTESTKTGADLLIAKQIVEGNVPAFAIVRIEQTEIENRLRSNINAKDGFMLTDQFLRPFCLIGTAENGS